MEIRVFKATLVLIGVLFVSAPAFAQAIEYRILATSKTSTMEKEMSEAGAAGFRFVDVMGGETAIGGQEVVVLMQKGGDVDGFQALGMIVGKTAIGGSELVVIARKKK